MAEIDSTEGVRRRISKLLAMAGDGRGNENESDTAMRMAEKLMRAHNIELSDLEASTGMATAYNWTSVQAGNGNKGAFASWRPMWVGYLAMGIAKFTDTKVSATQDGVRGHGMRFQGDAVDLEYALWLFETLRDFGYSEAMAVHGNCRENFKKAYSLRVQGRLFALRSERNAAMAQAKTATGSALMVLDKKIALRDAQFGKQKVSHRASNLRNAGFAEGQAAGNRANFSRPVGSGGGNLRIAA